MTTDTALYTLENLPELADDRWELVAGRIVSKVSPSTHHSLIQGRISGALWHFATTHQTGSMLPEWSLILRRNPDTVRVPDISFASFERVSDLGSRAFGTVPPELVVEIVSPSNTWSEMDRKVEEYFAFGVDCVWIVDSDRRLLFVYRSPDERTTLTEADTLIGDGVLEGFQLPLGGLFDTRPPHRS